MNAQELCKRAEEFWLVPCLVGMINDRCFNMLSIVVIGFAVNLALMAIILVEKK